MITLEHVRNASSVCTCRLERKVETAKDHLYSLEEWIWESQSSDKTSGSLKQAGEAQPALFGSGGFVVTKAEWY